MPRTKPTLNLPYSGLPRDPTASSKQPRTQSYLLIISQASFQAERKMK